MSAELRDKLEIENIEKSHDTNEAVHIDDADSDESEELTKEINKTETPNIKKDRNKNFIKTRRSSRRRASSMKKRSLSRNGFSSSLGKGNVNVVPNPYRTKCDKKCQNRPQGLPTKKVTDFPLLPETTREEKQANSVENKEFNTLSRGDL